MSRMLFLHIKPCDEQILILFECMGVSFVGREHAREESALWLFLNSIDCAP